MRLVPMMSIAVGASLSLSSCMTASRSMSGQSVASSSEASTVPKDELAAHSCAGEAEALAFRFEPSFGSDYPEGVERVDKTKLMLEVDACLDTSSGEERFDVVRAVIGNSQSDTVEVVSRDDLAVQAFASVAFSRPTIADFKLSVKLAPDRVLQLHGVDQADGSNYTEARWYRQADGDTLVPEGARWAGSIITGKPFEICPDGGYKHAYLTFEKTRIDYEYCVVGFSTSGGFNGQLKRVTVKDDHPLLGPAAGQAVKLSIEAAGSVVDERTHHHNICDSIKITLPSATYFITAGPAGAGGADEYLASCTKPENVHLANPQPPSGTPWRSVYKIVYPDGTALSGRLDALHYIKSNPNIVL